MSGVLAKCCCGTGSDCSVSSATLPCTISRASWDTSILEGVSASVRANREYQTPFPPFQNQDFITVNESIEAGVSGLRAEEVGLTVDGSFDTSQANLPKWRAVISAGTSPAEILSSQINSLGATASFTHERPYIYNISGGQQHEWRRGKIVTQRASSVVPDGAADLNNNPVTGQSAIDIEKSHQSGDILTPNPPQGSPATGCVTKFRSTIYATPTGILSYPVFASAVEVKTWYAEDGSVLDSETNSGSLTYENQLDFEYVRLGNQQKCDSYLGLGSERFAIVPSTGGGNNWVLNSPYALFAVDEFNRATIFMVGFGTDGVDLLQFLTGASFRMTGLPNEPLQFPLLRSQAVENVQHNGWDIEFLTLSHRVDIDTTTPAEYP